ncbi:MAG: type II toxin-antitoxin system VapC family toxin [Allosphingosinicella sp.]|uniref:type II toxin-antitoxin system VapC family toxin n=1 Tax=Allosphingosinicella sp. TaxID=2823234 RepID=UPI003930F554
MLVLDTSVALKWVVGEEGADAAAELIERALVAPDLFQAEVGNALAKKVRTREITLDQARGAYQEIEARVSLLPSPIYGSQAFAMGLALRHSVYDCYFLAAAYMQGWPMVTADRVFAGKVRGSQYAPMLFLLGEEIPDG